MLALAALILAVAVGGALATSAGAARSVVLGKTPHSPQPNCPTPRNLPDPPPPNRADEVCQVNGQVTGFQRSADDRKGLFRVKKAGHIVAWSVDLARPSRDEREAFGELAQAGRFESNPTAGISIIKRKDGRNYRLARSSPVLEVQRFYGEKPIFTLQQPLRVRPGHIVALTTVTWLPNFAAKNRKANEIWTASRTQKDFPDPTPSNNFRDCEVPPSVAPEARAEYFFAHSSPHRKTGTTRKYGCDYRRARLMYWAYFARSR